MVRAGIFAGAAGLILAASALAAQETAPSGAWRIVNLDAAFLVPESPERMPEIVFDAEAGRFAASVGCNRFAGGYTTDDGGLQFDEAVISTKMLCPPPLDALEMAFSALLPDVRGFVAAEGAAALLDDAGAVRAVLVARD